MGKIQRMNEQLANMIAAGEVIERPASVVKELLENAIDASSSQIDIELIDSGIRQIKVIDNGEGMGANDAMLAFERHATSKIKTQYDIFRIQTLGFRGEALPSIASVSDVHVRTSAGLESGTHLQIKGGEVLVNEPGLMRKGTEMEVNHLFFNTPARLKHIKSLNTELSHITDYINKIALSHPEIAIKLFNNNRLLFQTNGQNNLQSVISNIYGFDIAKKMIPFHAKNGDYEISGYLSDPIINRSSRNYMTIIVNGRAIRNYNLMRAITDAYHTLLPKDKYPIVVLNIKLDPILVDVNVHPAKLEVRFSQEESLKTFILSELKKIIHKVEYIPETTLTKTVAIDELKPIQQTMTFNQMPEILKSVETKQTSNSLNSPVEQRSVESIIAVEKTVQPDALQAIKNLVKRENEQQKNQSFVNEEESYLIVNPNPQDESVLPTSSVKELEISVPLKEKENQLMLYYIGQMHGTYLLAQNEEGLFIIDQHAAMERVQYEKNYKKLADVSAESVELLVPIMMQYTLNEIFLLKPSFKSLLEWGFEVEEFGQNALVVRSIPIWAQNDNIQNIVETIFQQILFENKFDIAKLRESVAITMSCKGSIKANQYINEHEIKQLLMDLCLCEQPYTCPHGRPIIVKFTKYEIEKLFKRVM